MIPCIEITPYFCCIKRCMITTHISQKIFYLFIYFIELQLIYNAVLVPARSLKISLQNLHTSTQYQRAALPSSQGALGKADCSPAKSEKGSCLSSVLLLLKELHPARALESLQPHDKISGNLINTKTFEQFLVFCNLLLSEYHITKDIQMEQNQPTLRTPETNSYTLKLFNHWG